MNWRTVLPSMVHALEHLHAAAALRHWRGLVPAHLHTYTGAQRRAGHIHAFIAMLPYHAVWDKVVACSVTIHAGRDMQERNLFFLAHPLPLSRFHEAWKLRLMELLTL